MEYDAKKLDRWIRNYAEGNDDLYQVGWLTILEAIPDYDAELGASFETWAFRRAKVYMARHRQQYRYAITHPQHNRPGITVVTKGDPVERGDSTGEPLVETMGQPQEYEFWADFKSLLEGLTRKERKNLLGLIQDPSVTPHRLGATLHRLRSTVAKRLEVPHQKKRRNRQVAHRGSSLKFKLNPKTVREIRKAHAEGASVTVLADKYKVTRRTVSKVVKGEIWAWVE